MMSPIVLAAVILTGSVVCPEFSLTLPRGVQAEKQRAGFETDSYDIRLRGERRPLMTILVGGGAYDLHGFQITCVARHRAWQQGSVSAGQVIFGDPGFDAVAVSYKNLSADQAMLAKGILHSMRLSIRPTCRP